MEEKIIYSKFNGGKKGYKNYNNIDKKIILKYILLGHNRQKISKKLNIGIDKLRRLMIKYKLKIPNKIDTISENEFKYYYYETPLSIKEICNKLNIGISLYNKFRKKYNCQKKGKIYFLKNKEKILKKRKEKREQWYLKNKETLWTKNRKYYKHKYHNDNNYKWKEYLRLSIRERIKKGNGNKKLKSEILIGCSINKLRKHLEKQFQEGMSWENYGHKGWHIDHIKPCASFDLTNEEEQKKCFHYTNLQPLWWYDNLKKGSKIIK